MIDICYALSDEKGTYSKFLGTSLWSLCEHHTAKDLHIHLLHDSTLTENEKCRLLQTVTYFQQHISFYNVEALAVDEMVFLRQELPNAGESRYTYAAFYRLLAAKILPVKVQRYIYLDADTVVNMDVGMLWQLSLKGHSVAAVAESDVIGSPADNVLVSTGYVEEYDYFNSGVLLVEKQKFLAVGDVLREGIHRLKKINSFSFYDQDILNLYFSHDYLHLDIAYNLFVPAMQLRGIQQLVPAIYHYDAGSLGVRVDDVYDRLFYTVFAKTLWCDVDFLYRVFARMELEHNRDLHMARQVFAVSRRRQRVFCANDASRAAIEQLFDYTDGDRYLTIRAQDGAERLLQYELISPKGLRLYILFSKRYTELSQVLMAAGWQEGENFMDGWRLLPAECGGHLYLRPELIRNL